MRRGRTAAVFLFVAFLGPALLILCTPPVYSLVWLLPGSLLLASGLLCLRVKADQPAVQGSWSGRIGLILGIFLVGGYGIAACYIITSELPNQYKPLVYRGKYLRNWYRDYFESKDDDSRGKALHALLEALQEGDRNVRRDVAFVFVLSYRRGRFTRKEKDEVLQALVPALIEILNKYPSNRLGAAIDLGELGPEAKAAVPALAKALKAGDNNFREKVAEAIGQIGPEASAAVPALLEAMKASEWGLRGCAAEAIGRIRPAPDDVVPALESALQDNEDFVRMKAAEALWRVSKRGEKGIPVLIELLRGEISQDRHVYRIDIMEILGRIGPQAKAAVPLLLKDAQAEDQYRRKVARIALKKIDPNSLPRKVLR
jgi:HEAT repeat protein